MAIKSEGVIERIDKGLAEYYEDFGRKDYKNSDGIGKFVEFVENNGFEDEDVIDELKEGDQCTLVELDEDDEANNMFPLNPPIEDEAARNKEIVRILNCIAQTGSFKVKQKRKELSVSICSDITPKEIDETMEKYLEQMDCFANLADKDKALKHFLGVSNKQNFPFLTYMVDSYTRDKAKHYGETGKSLLLSQWANKNPFMKALRYKSFNNKTMADILQQGMASYMNRIMNRLQFETVYIINDNLREIAEYIVSIPMFIHKLMDNLQGKAPFQVDLLIAVKKVTSTVDDISRNENNEEDDDEDDEDEDETKTEALDPNIDHIGNVKDKLKNYPLHHFPKENWDIDETKQSIEAIARTLSYRYSEFRTKLSKHRGYDDNNNNDDDGKKGNDHRRWDPMTYPMNRRFAIFVDRRRDKPTNKGDDDDKKSDEEYNDQMAYFEPPNDCNYFKHDHVPEIGFEFIRKCIIPDRVNQTKTALDGMCGQLMTFMFNVEQDDEIRCYIVWNGQTMRFHGEHIIQVLPSLFEKSKENVEFIEKGEQAKKMERMFDSVTRDCGFDPFYEELRKFGMSD